MEARTPSSYVVAPPSSGTGWLIQALSLLRDQAGRLLLIAVLMQLILVHLLISWMPVAARSVQYL